MENSSPSIYRDVHGLEYIVTFGHLSGRCDQFPFLFSDKYIYQYIDKGGKLQRVKGSAPFPCLHFSTFAFF